MITLTREEAQQVLDALDSKYIVNCGAWRVQRDAAIETLRAHLAEPVVCSRCGEVNPAEIHTCTPKEQLSAADQYAHRLALMLECLMLSPSKTWNAASDLLSEYHEAVRKEHEAAGEPYVSGFGKD